ncbi:MAG: glycosyltransferase, partial [Planctomycetaceae bacterium]|nr:glycosyltransferase [Planctomycetaceae bacterium]
KVAGGTGRGRFGDDFIQLARDEGVADRIAWLGFQNQAQIDELLRTSLCLVFTSVVEGFGLPPLEAMARRCPVVACNATAMPEIIQDAGLLVEPRQAGQFAESVIRLHRDEQLRQTMAERGLERAKDFPASSSAAKLCEVFHKVTGLPVQGNVPVRA